MGCGRAPGRAPRTSTQPPTLTTLLTTSDSRIPPPTWCRATTGYSCSVLPSPPCTTSTSGLSAPALAGSRSSSLCSWRQLRPWLRSFTDTLPILSQDSVFGLQRFPPPIQRYSAMLVLSFLNSLSLLFHPQSLPTVFYWSSSLPIRSMLQGGCQPRPYYFDSDGFAQEVVFTACTKYVNGIR